MNKKINIMFFVSIILGSFIFTNNLLAVKYLLPPKKPSFIDFYEKSIFVSITVQADLTNASTNKHKTEALKDAIELTERLKIQKAVKLFRQVNLTNQKTLLEYLFEKGWDQDVLERIITFNARPVKTTYFSDGSIRQLFKIPLSYLITANHFSEFGTAIDPPSDRNTYTGLIIELPENTNTQPALIIEIITENKRVIYSKKKIDFNSFRQSGMAYYATKPLRYKNEGSVGKNPLTITALPSSHGSTIIIPDKDADHLLALNNTLDFLKTGNVIIVYQGI